MGLSEEEWRRMTVREFNLLSRRHIDVKRAARKREDWRAALIASTIYNSASAIIATIAKKKTYKKLKIEDFMPRETTNSQKKSWQEIKAMTMAYVSSLPGKGR